MTSWLNRLRTEVAPPKQTQTSPQTPITPRAAAYSRDPNSPDHRYNINQKCIYERRLPGGSYITAHIQRLQSGYYDSPMVHEDLIENVRFVAINFVFHPSRSNFRFKTAEISVALHRDDQDHHPPRPKPRFGTTSRDSRADSNDEQGSDTYHSQALIPTGDVKNGHLQHHPQRHARSSPPRFLRHAPHLLFGAISPETLNWNFNLAGSVGVTQGPANATLSPSGGVNGSYKLYEMMRIQGSMRGLHSWFGHTYDIEDAEIVWTLEENRLQKSGLPREFTFVMLLTKGVGGGSYDEGGLEGLGEVQLEIDIKPVVAGFMGMSRASYPGLVTNMLHYQPLHKDMVDLDQEIGQKFRPEIPGKGFNFAELAKDFDDFVWMPGTTWSTKEDGGGTMGEPGQKPVKETADKGRDDGKGKADGRQKARDNPPQLSLSGSDNTLNLRVFLEPSRGSSLPVLPYASLNLRPQPPYSSSRGPSPLHVAPVPPSTASTTPSKSTSKRRSITIVSSAHHSNNRGHDHPPSHSTKKQSSNAISNRRVSRSPTLRRQTSRSSLDKEYRSSPPTARGSADTKQMRPYTVHEPFLPPMSHLDATETSQRPVSWYDHNSTPPPPKTASSEITDSGTVVHHPPIEWAESPVLPKEDRRASHQSDRVKTRQAKVTQTPYPVDLSPPADQRTHHPNQRHSATTRTRALRYGDESSSSSAEETQDPKLTLPPERQETDEDQQEAQVPIIAVPRKSSRRQSQHLTSNSNDSRDSHSNRDGNSSGNSNRNSNATKLLTTPADNNSSHSNSAIPTPENTASSHTSNSQHARGTITFGSGVDMRAAAPISTATASTRTTATLQHVQKQQPTQNQHTSPSSATANHQQADNHTFARSTTTSTPTPPLFHDAPESLPPPPPPTDAKDTVDASGVVGRTSASAAAQLHGQAQPWPHAHAQGDGEGEYDARNVF